MLEKALRAFFFMNPWAEVVRDYLQDEFKERGIAWRLPTGARRVGEELIITFNDEQWRISIKSEKI